MNTEKDYDLLRRARMALLDDAITNQKTLSAYEWERRALESEAGKIVGPAEVDRFVRFVWCLK